MTFKRLIMFSSQWLLANILMFLVIDNVMTFALDMHGVVLLLVLNILWLVPVIGEALVPAAKVKIRDKEYCYHLWMGAMLLELLAAGFEYSHYRLGVHTLSTLETITGLALICLGFVCSFIGWVSIRSFVSPQFQIIENHRVIDGGLYYLIRHPIYAGFFLIGIGIPIFIRSFIGLVVFLLVVAPIWLYVIREEERFLLAHLNEDYQTYRQKTKKLLPYVY